MKEIKVGTRVKILYGQSAGEYGYVERVYPFNRLIPGLGHDKYEVLLENGHRDFQYFNNLKVITEDKKLSEISESEETVPRSNFIVVYFSERALEYFWEAGDMKDYFKKFLDRATIPKYRKLTNEELTDIEGLQETYGAKSLGTPKNTIPIKLPDDIKISDHAQTRMKERNITKDQLQIYIDTSMFMFNQAKGRTRLYVSSSGSIVVSVKYEQEGIVVTVYSVQDYYTDQLGPIVEEVKKWLTSQKE